MTRLNKSCYGITYAPHLELHVIKFRASSKQVPYLRTNPIHHSQQEIAEGIFQFTAYFSYELLQELLSYGSSIEILSPVSIQQRIKEEALKIIEIYSKNKED